MGEKAPASSEDLKRHSTVIQRSADSFAQSAEELVGEADRRTSFASDRTLLASERTYAAWVRTALAALGGGIGARALVKGVLPEWVGKVSGTVLILFAAFCLIAAVWRELDAIPHKPHPDIRRIPERLLIPMNGLLLLVTLAALIGIWEH